MASNTPSYAANIAVRAFLTRVGRLYLGRVFDTRYGKGEEDWTVNKAVHFNEWANFSPNDFMPIVNAFKDLLACAQCDDCGSWLYITPKGTSPEGLRCSCNSVNLNLKKKPK